MAEEPTQHSAKSAFQALEYDSRMDCFTRLFEMEAEIYCCDPLGNHEVILRATKKSKDKFRVITEELVSKSDVPLQVGNYLCSKCRPQIVKHHQRATVEDLTESDSKKFVSCKDPLNLHMHPKRQGPGQRFFKCTEGLAHEAMIKGIQIEKGERLCFDCRSEVLKKVGDPDRLQKCCADPRNTHKASRSNSILYVLKDATPEEINTARALELQLKEGSMLCISCRLFLKKQRRALQPVSEVEQMDMDEDEGPTSVALHSLVEEESMDCLSDPASSNSANEEDVDSDDNYCNPRVDSLKMLEKAATDLKIRLPNASSLREGNNASELYVEMKKKLAEVISQASGRRISVGGSNCDDCSTHVFSLKQRYEALETKSKKYELLTSVPKWVTAKKLQHTFNIAPKMSRKVVELRSSHGPLSSPPPKVGRPLDAAIVASVQKFYLSPENSRVSPNLRDVRIVSRTIVDGKIVKERAAKQEILVTLKELHREYRLTHPEHKICRDKFAKLKPAQCVWGYKRGFQKTCVCSIHSNFNHLLSAIKLPDNTHTELTNFFCSLQADCLLGACNHCPKWDPLDQFLDQYEHDAVECWQWAYTGDKPKRIELVRQTRSKEEFKVYFKEVALKVAEHHFVYSSQKEFIRGLKTIRPTEEDKATLFVDFGQNHSFVLPEEVAGLHWSHKQATVHPFVLHYLCPKTKTTKVAVYTVISDWLAHNANSFHAFRSFVLENYIKQQFPHIKRISYVSDGPSSQYKNLYNFINLANHTKDFGIFAEWIFSATSHGKSQCDAMSALAKRLTRLEGMRRKDNFILTAADMVEFLNAQNTFKDRFYVYVSEETAKSILSATKVEERYLQYGKVKDTRQFHYVVPFGSSKIRCRKFAKSSLNYDYDFGVKSKVPSHPNRPPPDANPSVAGNSQQRLYPALSLDEAIPSAPPFDASMNSATEAYKVGDYVATLVNGTFVLGTITRVNEDELEFGIKLMQKSPRGQNYKYRDPERIIYMVEEDIICRLPAPVTLTGRTYTFDDHAVMAAQATAVHRVEQLKA